MESRSNSEHKCEHCEETATKRCSRCHMSCYCSQKCQKKAWERYHKSQCFAIGKTLVDNPKNKLLHFALNRNLFKEYKALDVRFNPAISKNANKNTSNLFDEGRYWLLKAIVEMILFSPEKPFDNTMFGRVQKFATQECDVPQDVVIFNRCTEYAKKSAHTLWNNGGEKDMGDRLVFSFIPWSCIDLVATWWDGIGGWVKDGAIQVSVMQSRASLEKRFGLTLDS